MMIVDTIVVSTLKVNLNGFIIFLVKYGSNLLATLRKQQSSFSPKIFRVGYGSSTN